MKRDDLENLIIEKPREDIYMQAKSRWDNIAKPISGMGRFESIIARIASILGTPEFNLEKKAVVVMCADNGIVAEGISQSDQNVTLSVAASMGSGRSAVGRMAKRVGADVYTIDIGINSAEEIPGVINKKVRRGTRNFIKKPAMTEAETLMAIESGIQAAKFCRENGYNIMATGDMGIGNTSTSAAVAAALLSAQEGINKERDCVSLVRRLTGRGAGLDDEGLERKRNVIKEALDRYNLKESDTLRVLECVGGLDIAGMAGIFIGGAVYRIPVVIDGVVSAAAALSAEMLRPGTREYMIASHKSAEPAAGIILERLGLEPVLHADMALGEGTGAVMMLMLLDAAMSVYEGAATFDDIKIEKYVEWKGH